MVSTTSPITIAAAIKGYSTANHVRPTAATSSMRLSPTFENGSGEAETVLRSASFAP
jgi:hypothetical protein